MLYSDLIRQETEYTYSANVQFDIENDKKLARFIPNETTIELFREYFIDTIRTNPNIAGICTFFYNLHQI